MKNKITGILGESRYIVTEEYYKIERIATSLKLYSVNDLLDIIKVIYKNDNKLYHFMYYPMSEFNDYMKNCDDEPIKKAEHLFKGSFIYNDAYFWVDDISNNISSSSEEELSNLLHDNVEIIAEAMYYTNAMLPLNAQKLKNLYQ